MYTQKISAISKRVPSNTVKLLQEFFGRIGYYRKFIKDSALISIPLLQLLKKEVKLIWEEDHKNAFENLKRALVSNRVFFHLLSIVK